MNRQQPTHLARSTDTLLTLSFEGNRTDPGISLDAGVTTIGRVAMNDVVVSDPDLFETWPGDSFGRPLLV